MEQAIRRLDPEQISSERIRFRYWTEDDLDFVYEMNGSPEVMKYFPGTMSLEECRSFIRKVRERYQSDPFCWYAAELKESGELIGMLGLALPKFKAHFTPCTEVGWRLLPRYWGKGLATEGSRSMIKAAFERAGVDSVYSFTPTINVPSERVMIRSGMTKIGEFDHPLIADDSILKRHVLYWVDKP